MAVQEFLATHPVFTYEEFAEYLSARDSSNVKTRKSLLTYYLDAGRITRVRRGLYVSVPRGQAPETVQPDPFLLASRMTPDAVLAYHTALEFHGRAYSVFRELVYLADTSSSPATFRGNTFRSIHFPRVCEEEREANTCPDF